MMRTRQLAAGIGTAVLLTLSGGGQAWADAPGMQAWADAPGMGAIPVDDSGDSDKSEDRDRNADSDNDEYRGDDDSTRNSDETLADVDLLNTSPDENSGEDDK
jgi:hypothetical protein